MLSTALETRHQALETLGERTKITSEAHLQKTGDGPGRRVPDKTSRLCVTSSTLRLLGDKSRTRHVCNLTQTHMLFMSLFLQTCRHVVNHLPRTSHHDEWVFKRAISSENKNRHVGSYDKNQTTPGTVFQTPLDLQRIFLRKSFLRSPTPCSSFLNWQHTLGSFGQHGLFIRLAICETCLPRAFAILRQQSKVHTISTLTILCR